MSTLDPDDFPCNLFVEVVTDYLEGALTPDDVARLEAHLDICPGCRSVLEQFREVIRITGRLRKENVEQLDPVAREPLMAVFRDWAGRSR